jgi:hypothetical protein
MVRSFQMRVQSRKALFTQVRLLYFLKYIKFIQVILLVFLRYNLQYHVTPQLAVSTHVHIRLLARQLLRTNLQVAMQQMETR